MIDLRSDTVTRPTPSMREAMAGAEVGDDVFGEDPTVAELEATTAKLFGFDAALFVPSGTMGNQIGIRLLVPPGSELVCEGRAHVVSFQGGGGAQHGGIQTRTLFARGGIFSVGDVSSVVHPNRYSLVATRAVAVEQTHNRGGGAVYPLTVLQELRAAMASAGIAMHCDGARIWNAHVATGIKLSEYGALFDTLSVCFSKGLGAPVGSALMCSREALPEARRLRQQLGGGMRQSGILAAAALYALQNHLDRIEEDHRHAREIARQIAAVRPDVVTPELIETNIVRLDLSPVGMSAAEFSARAADEGVLVAVADDRTVRLVTHLDIDSDDVSRAATVLRGVL